MVALTLLGSADWVGCHGLNTAGYLAGGIQLVWDMGLACLISVPRCSTAFLLVVAYMIYKSR